MIQEIPKELVYGESFLAVRDRLDCSSLFLLLYFHSGLGVRHFYVYVCVYRLKILEKRGGI